MRRCLKVCCRSRRAVPGLRSLLALSAGRCTGPSTHRASALRVKRRKTGRKTRGTKGVGGRVSAKGHGVVERDTSTSASTARGKPRRSSSQGPDVGRDHDGRFVGGCSCWHPRTRSGGASLRCEKRHPTMEGVLVRLQPVGFHDRTVTTSSACTRFIDTHAKARAGGHVKATGASEVGPHRAPRVNSPEARWRDPLKRAVRRENGMSLGTHRIGATLTGAEAIGSKARSSRRDLPENSRARVHEVEVVWMAGVGGAHPACAKGREARADASRRRNSNAVDAASRDPKANRCDGVRRFSLNGKTQHDDSRVERHVNVHTAPGVSGSTGSFTFTGGRARRA